MVSSAGDNYKGRNEGGFKYNVKYNHFGSAKGYDKENLKGGEKGNISSLAGSWFGCYVVLASNNY